MTVRLNETHDPAVTSWVESANQPEALFPIQNLPLGVFRRAHSADVPVIGVAIGDRVLDLAACAAAGLLRDAEAAAAACTASSLNRLMACGPTAASQLRRALFAFLRDGSLLRPRVPPEALVPMREIELLMPAVIGDYSDFFASIHHATNAGRLFRPDAPLLPNYRHVPIAYHGRASSVIVSGRPVRRPIGQSKSPDWSEPAVGASRKLDYELELGFFIGSGNTLGEPIPLARAEEHVFGMCLVNDWSARDIQAWEYQPLGPFLGKSFGTTISPWVVTLEALAPFRTAPSAREAETPQVLPYLRSQHNESKGGLDIKVDVAVASQDMRERGDAPHVLASTSSSHLYWTIAQMVTHHTMNGCNLRPGDLIATGTLSGPTEQEYGSLLELTLNGQRGFSLPGGEPRTFIEDGDEVVLRGHCEREGFRSIGFGEARATILPALPTP